MEVFILYFFISGLIYASYLLDLKDPLWVEVLTILFGFIEGWLITPILIGRMIAQIYKDE